MPRKKKKIETTVVIKKNLQRRQPKNDYLKYYRVVRYWAKRKYNLKDQDLEILFFVATERLFSKTEFENYASVFSWNKNRFKNLLRDGWIQSFRNAEGGLHALYEATFKTRRMLDTFYKLLNGEQGFPVDPRNNPVFKRETYTDKVMAHQMLSINKKFKDSLPSIK